jgi:hypothetical protein
MGGLSVPQESGLMDCRMPRNQTDIFTLLPDTSSQEVCLNHRDLNMSSAEYVPECHSAEAPASHITAESVMISVDLAGRSRAER